MTQEILDVPETNDDDSRQQIENHSARVRFSTLTGE